MGVIGQLFDLLFGEGRNVVKETAEVLWGNQATQAAQDSTLRRATLEQFAAEFAKGDTGKSGFDRVMDGLNRIPRPLMAFGTIGLCVSAMIDPVWFAARMQGLALVPEPLWWLLGTIVSFYFGARYQAKSQDFQRAIADSLARLPQKPFAQAGPHPAFSEFPVSDQTSGAVSSQDVPGQDAPNPALEAIRKALGARSEAR